MVQIVTPTLPRRLYRYRSMSSQVDGEQWTTDTQKLQREIQAIRENYLWCSRLEAFNDPMEGVFSLSPTAARASDGALVPPKVQAVIRKMGVCCFSDDVGNPLMWAHYAGGSRGVCIKYSTNDLDRGLPEAQFVRVQYDLLFPNLRAGETPNLELAAVKAVSSKKADWQYEREWRLLAKAHGQLAIDGENPVKAIFFGARTPSHVIDIFRT